MIVSVLPFLLCAAAVSCADDEPPPETLTCEAIASPDFCWTVGVGEAYTCVDPSLSPGMFNADRTECTYSDGTRIVFDEAIPMELSGEDDYLWKFSILDAGGAECVRFDETDRGFTVMSSGGTVDQRGSGIFGLDLTCPDGEVLHTSNGLDLLSCEEPDAVIPGYSFIRSGSSVSWSLIGAPEGTSGLWSCQEP